jgi:hypothetical protein
LGLHVGIEAVHIISHGDNGTVFLGSDEVNAASLMAEADQVAGWGDAFTTDADILLYGCDIAGSQSGIAFAQSLANLTGADVAASDDDSGSANRGGDWDLEFQTGAVEADLAPTAASLAAFDGLLAAPDPGGATAVVDPADDGAVSVTEDSGTPGSANIRLTVPTLNDPDGLTPTEIRIVSVNGGTLSQGDGSPITLGTSGTALTLTGSSIDLRFTPDADQDVDATFDYVVVDPDDSNVNSASSTATVSISAVNDAPVLTSIGNMTDINEDVASGANAGTSIADLLAASTISDVDTGALEGLAIVGSDDSGGGTWQFSTNGGTNWQDLGAVSDSSALLLSSAANNLVRFQPTTSFDGTATLTVRAWDQASGTSGGTVSTAANGGVTAFSSATGTVTQTVIGDQDAPVLNSTGDMTDIDEDVSSGSNTGTSVADILASSSITDLDDGAVEGLAIVGADDSSGGSWQFSTNGGTDWQDLGPRAESNALLLSPAATNLVRFQPDADFNGDATLTIRAWDQTTGTSGSSVLIAANGGNSAFSSATGTVTQTVNPVNDAPTLDGAVALPSIIEDVADGANTGVTVALLLQDANGDPLVEDIDGDTVGIAVTATGGITGTWQFFDATWQDFPAVSGSSALLLDATTLVRFVPDLVDRPILDLRLVSIETAASSQIRDRILFSNHGGSIAVQRDESGADVPVQSLYKVTLELAEPMPELMQMIRGKVVLDAERQSVLGEVWQSVVGTLRREFSF